MYYIFTKIFKLKDPDTQELFCHKTSNENFKYTNITYKNAISGADLQTKLFTKF